jgi:small ligand-binding sensory domain FIST
VLEVIHTPHRFDRVTGSMGFPGGGLSPGPVRMVRRDGDAVRSSAVMCAQRLRDALGAQRPAFVLQFDCAGRGQTLFGPETSDAIVRPLREALGGDAPWVGFHAYGEIAPVRGRARYHNYTVALCALFDA